MAVHGRLEGYCIKPFRATLSPDFLQGSQANERSLRCGDIGRALVAIKVARSLDASAQDEPARGLIFIGLFVGAERVDAGERAHLSLDFASLRVPESARPFFSKRCSKPKGAPPFQYQVQVLTVE